MQLPNPTMLFNAVNEYVLAFLISQVDTGDINPSILETWKTQENGLKILLEKNDKIKKKKDANAPKGAKSAYILFCADERPKVKEEEPDMDSKKIAAELGKRWKELKDDDEEKVKEYQKMAEKDKLRFNTEMENYVPGEEVVETKTKKTKTKDKNAPKGAKSGYILFCSEERAQVKEDMPNIDSKEVLAELGKRWKALKDDDEDRYNAFQKMAEKDKVRFKTEMENYVPGEEVEKDNKKTKKTKDKNAPKGAKSGYILFCSEERAQVKEDMPNIDSKEVLAELGKRWKVLKDEDEDRYNEFQKMAEKDKVRFKNEMENYVPGEEVEKDNKKTKKTKTKDKNAPKGAKSAYILFCSEERAQVKEDMPNIDSKEVLAELGKRWKTLKDDDEDRYNEFQKMAEKDKVRFKTEMENYVPGEEVEKDNKETKEKKKKDKNAPKGAKSAYILFCSEERAQVKKDMPDIDSKNVLTELGKRWKVLKENDEDRYNEFQVMAEKDKLRFKNEMKNYVPEETEDEDEEGKNKKKDKDTPKRSKTAYQMFCEEQKEAVKQGGFEGKEVISELARRWKELESEDEDYFKDLKSRAEKLKKEFQVANPVEEKEKKIKKDDKKDKVEKDEKKVDKDDKKVVTKVKVTKKKTNEQIVSDILDSFEDETCTMRMIRKKLEEMEITIDKKELKEIVDKYNEDN